MKRFLCALLLCIVGLAGSWQSHAAGSVLQATDLPGGVCNLTCSKAFTSTVTAGSTLVYFALGSGTSDIVSGVADNVNGAWTRCAEFSNGTNAEWCYYFQNSSAGTITVTVTVTVASSTQRLSIYELGGVATSGQPDVTSVTGNTASSTSQATTNLTPTSSGDFLLCYLAVNVGSATSFAPASSETENLEDATNERYQAESKTISGTTATACSWTLGAARTGGFIMFGAKVAGATSPTLTSASLAAATGGYTLTGTSNTSSTLYIAAYTVGTTAPANCPAVIAHSGAAGNTSGAISSGSVSLSLTGMDFPKYDVYWCSSNGAGSTSVGSASNQTRGASSGKQWVVFGTLNSGSSTDPSPYYAFASPAVASGDILEAGTTVLPGGYALTVSAAGDVSYPDTTGLRQYDDERIYDVSAVGWMATDTSGTVFRLWLNGLKPTVPPLNSVIIRAPLIGVAMTPVDLRQYCTDPQGDTVTVTNLNSMPSGTVVSGSIVSGTPSAAGVFPVQFRCTNAAEDFADF